MNSHKSDIFAVAASMVSVLVFSFLLYSDINRNLLAKDAKQIGTISFKKKTAMRKYSNQAIWGSIDQNSPVYNNDSIKTEEDAEAVVHLDDGTEIGMEENSLILFSKDQNKFDIDFKQGSIFANKSGAEDGSQVNITSGESVIAIDKGDAQLTKTSADDISISVSAGEAKYITSSGQLVIAENQALVSLASGTSPTLRKNSIILDSPDNNKIFISSSQIFDVDFSHSEKNNPEAVIEISTKRDFSENLVSLKKITSAKLKEGRYYWRVKSKSASGELTLSDTRRFALVYDTPVIPTNPAENNVFYFDSNSPLVIFKWTKSVLASFYLLEISDDKSFSSILRSVQTPLTQIALDDLPEGSYFWRIKTIVNLTKTEGLDPLSRTASFKISKKTGRTPPVLTTESNIKFNVKSAGNDGIVLSWQADSSASGYEVLVASDESFSNIVHSEKTTSNFIKISKPLPKNTYYWKVREDIPNGSGIFSNTSKFTIFDAEPSMLTFPANNSVKILSSDEQESSMSFGWTKTESSLYLIEISTTPQFLDTHTRLITSESNLSGIKMLPGQYFWKIKSLDSLKNELSVSSVFTFTISKPVTLSADSGSLSGSILTPDSMPGSAETATATKDTVLQINTKVKNSEIIVDGQTIGKKSASINVTAGRPVSVTIKAYGYETYNQTITLAEKENKQLDVNLVEDPSQYRIRWTFNPGRRQAIQPVITENSIITVSDNRSVYSHGFSGNLIWKTDLEGIVKSQPVLNKNNLYIIDVNGVLYSISVDKGVIAWKNRIDGQLIFNSSPLFIDDYIYFATTVGVIYSFTQQGSERYKRGISGGVFSSLDYYSKKDFLIAGTDQSKVLFLKRSNGDEIWNFSTESRIANSSPSVSGNLLYVPTIDGTLYCISIDNSREIWRYKSESPLSTKPLVIDDVLLFGNSSGSLTALNSNTGSELWNKYISSSPVNQPFLSSGGIMYVTAGNTLYSFSIPTAGTVAWTFGFETQASTAPSAFGNHILVGLYNGSILSLKEDIYKD